MSGNLNFNVFHTLVFKVPESSEPCNMGINRINGQANKFGIHCLNSSAIEAKVINSVVHTGVKSEGWENRITHFPL